MVLLETQAHGADWLSHSNHHEIIFRLYPAYFSPKSLLLVPSPISGTWWCSGEDQLTALLHGYLKCICLYKAQRRRRGEGKSLQLWNLLPSSVVMWVEVVAASVVPIGSCGAGTASRGGLCCISLETHPSFVLSV